MFMEKIKCVNNKIEEKILMLCEENDNIKSALSSISSIYPEFIIKDIMVIADEYVITILVNSDEREVIINKNGIILNINYISKIQEKFMDGNHMVMVKKHSDDSLECIYSDETKKIEFKIIIKMLGKMDSTRVVEELLDENHGINNIKDVYYAIDSSIDLEKASLIIKSSDNLSFLEVMHNIISKYQFVEKKGNRVIREYLGDDGKFYLDEVVSSELGHERIPFVKLKVR